MLVRPRVSKYQLLTFIPTNMVYVRRYYRALRPMILGHLPSCSHLSHEHWAQEYSSSLETRYAIQRGRLLGDVSMS